MATKTREIIGKWTNNSRGLVSFSTSDPDKLITLIRERYKDSLDVSLLSTSKSHIIKLSANENTNELESLFTWSPPPSQVQQLTQVDIQVALETPLPDEDNEEDIDDNLIEFSQQTVLDEPIGGEGQSTAAEEGEIVTGEHVDIDPSNDFISVCNGQEGMFPGFLILTLVITLSSSKVAVEGPGVGWFEHLELPELVDGNTHSDSLTTHTEQPKEPKTPKVRKSTQARIKKSKFTPKSVKASTNVQPIPHRQLNAEETV